MYFNHYVMQFVKIIQLHYMGQELQAKSAINDKFYKTGLLLLFGSN